MNFQGSSSRQGAWFEDACLRVLLEAGFGIDAMHQTIADAGVEVDFIATSRVEISFYVLCKGSFRGRRPGLRRTDTLKKALAEAQALRRQGWAPVLLLTSHLPNTPAGRALLAGADPDVLFDAIALLDGERRLSWLAEASEAWLRADMARRRASFAAAPEQACFGSWRAAR
jgi:hypothetical protein